MNQVFHVEINHVKQISRKEILARLDSNLLTTSNCTFFKVIYCQDLYSFILPFSKFLRFIVVLQIYQITLYR